MSRSLMLLAVAMVVLAVAVNAAEDSTVRSSMHRHVYNSRHATQRFSRTRHHLKVAGDKCSYSSECGDKLFCKYDSYATAVNEAAPVGVCTAEQTIPAKCAEDADCADVTAVPCTAAAPDEDCQRRTSCVFEYFPRKQMTDSAIAAANKFTVSLSARQDDAGNVLPISDSTWVRSDESGKCQLPTDFNATPLEKDAVVVREDGSEGDFKLDGKQQTADDLLTQFFNNKTDAAYTYINKLDLTTSDGFAAMRAAIQKYGIATFWGEPEVASALDTHTAVPTTGEWVSYNVYDPALRRSAGADSAVKVISSTADGATGTNADAKFAALPTYPTAYGNLIYKSLNPTLNGACPTAGTTERDKAKVDQCAAFKKQFDFRNANFMIKLLDDKQAERWDDATGVNKDTSKPWAQSGAALSQHHVQIIPTNNFNWDLYNVATLGLSSADASTDEGKYAHFVAVKQALLLIDEMVEIARDYAQVNGWSQDLGLYFQMYSRFDKVQYISLHAVDEAMVGPAYEFEYGTRSSLITHDVVIDVLEAEARDWLQQVDMGATLAKEDARWAADLVPEAQDLYAEAADIELRYVKRTPAPAAYYYY